MSRALTPDDITQDLGTHCIGRVVRCVAAVDSTNDAAFAAAAEGAPEGAVVVADVQTAGRGRLGRAWSSPEGGLWCSVVLRDLPPPEHRAFLTVLAAVALCRALESLTDTQPRIRWPNDVLCAGRKVAGVLVEVRDGGPEGTVAVIGVGCNVDRVPADLPADIAAVTTCVADVAGRPVSRLELLRALCRGLDDAWAACRAGAFAELDAEWRERSAVLGRTVRVTVGTAVSEGTVVAIGAADGVTLQSADGERRRFRSEHITRLELR